MTLSYSALADAAIIFSLIIVILPPTLCNTTVTNTSVDKILFECETNSSTCVGVSIKDRDDEVDCKSNCDYLVTFHHDLDKSIPRINFTLASRRQTGYVAVGISMDEKMGDDLVFVCLRESSHTVVKSYLSWNRGHQNHRLADQSVVILSSFGMTPEGIYCEFSIPVALRVNGEDFMLKENYYHLLLAGGSVRKNHIRYHDARTSTVRLRLGLSEFFNVKINTTKADYAAEKIHAGYMMFSWIVWIPCGTFASRFYKETWTNSFIWSKRFWFIIHTFCMLFAIVMSMTAYILVLYDRDQWIPLEPPASIHGIIGIIALSLLIIQCIAGWFRPSEMIPKLLVSKLHCFAGLTCYMLGIFNVILAPILTSNILPCSVSIIAGVWLVVHLLLYTMMSSYIFWTDWHLQIGGWRAYLGYPMPIATSEESARPRLRKAVLGLFILLSVTFAFIGIGAMKCGDPCAPTYNLECSTL